MKYLSSLIVCLFVLSYHYAQQTLDNSSVLFKSVSVVNVEDGSISDTMNVLIQDGKIASIVPSSEDKLDASASTIIDGEGYYLMPGLAEMHAHIPPPSAGMHRIEDVLFLYLSNGITTIRGMLGDPLHLQLREKAKSGELLSPRIFTSSPSLNGNSVTSIEEAVSKVSSYKTDGYDFLKIHPGIQLEIFNAIVETAKKVNIPFAGHVPVDVGIRHALHSQYASIDHIDGFLEGLVPEHENVNPNDNGFFGYAFTPLADVKQIEELVALAKENKVWIVPTQSLFTRWFAPISATELLAQDEMVYMPKSTLQNWERVKNNSIEDNTFNVEQWQRFNTIRKLLIKNLYDNGHGMLLGSDAPQLFNVPGFSIHHEMSDMKDAGLSELDIIKTGTINPAIFFGQESQFGSIKKGMIADLILLESNPLEALEAIQNPKGVMVAGRWLSRSAIDKRLAIIEEKCSNN